MTVGRRNWLFAGSKTGGERAAAIYTVIQTCKANGVDPQAWLTDTLTHLANGHRINALGDLMPWTYAARVAD